MDQVNNLLDLAPAQTIKSFQLYKLCLSENIWLGSWPQFQEKLDNYYRSVPRLYRKKNHLDMWLHRPISQSLVQEFNLSFRTAQIDHSQIQKISSWAFHLSRTAGQKMGPLFSENVFFNTIQQIIRPENYLDLFEFELEDFYLAFQKTTEKMFGDKWQDTVKLFISELKFNEIKRQNEDKPLPDKNVWGAIRPTWLNWIQQTKEDLENERKIKLISLKTEHKEWLISQVAPIDIIEKLVKLYNLSLDPEQTALHSKISDIKATLIEHQWVVMAQFDEIRNLKSS